MKRLLKYNPIGIEWKHIEDNFQLANQVRPNWLMNNLDLMVGNQKNRSWSIVDYNLADQ